MSEGRGVVLLRLDFRIDILGVERESRGLVMLVAEGLGGWRSFITGLSSGASWIVEAGMSLWAWG